MQQLNSTQREQPQDGSAHFGSIPKPTESFGTMQNDTESFGTIPHNAEGFRSVLTNSERKENHTLTVREVARLFEMAGVARTERSIINWCQPNKMGVARLDFYFDPNERKYFISPQSVEAAIQEEKAKAMRGMDRTVANEPVPKRSETVENLDSKPPESNHGMVRELEMEIRDLQIATRVKDGIIDRLEKDRESFSKERQHYIDELMSFNRKVGELETKLLQIEGPHQKSGDASEE